RREARRRAVPAGLVKLMLHRWGAACLPKNRAALSARARAATPPPQTHTQTRPSSASAPPASQVPARQGHADAANVAARRPLREREEAAAVAVARAPTPTGFQDKPVTVAGGGSGDTATTVGRGENIWVRVPRKRTSSPQVDSPQQLSVESTAGAAEDEYVWADRYRPSVLGEFICNKAVADELHRLVHITNSSVNKAVADESTERHLHPGDRTRVQPFHIRRRAGRREEKHGAGTSKGSFWSS
uniref:Uncharacterized protein n=1 Tax=Aegilops tauschii subsp. strangulata TaxID=200361 RepID=A0A452XCI2_AEGTS